VVGFAGAADGPGAGAAVADGGVDLGVGKDGSVGPAPGEATGRPPMTELQPETSSEPAIRATSSSEPPARLRRAFFENRTRRSPDDSYSGTQVTHRDPKVAALAQVSI
jgi:hypothetical protein